MPSGVYARNRPNLFFKKVNKNGPIPANRPELGPCWIWVGKLDRNGYGKFRGDGRDVFAHRWAYEFERESLPERKAPDFLGLDHLCRNPACVNPSHLELVSHTVNLRRGESNNAKKTHCPKGHPYDDANTLKTKCGRKCRECCRQKAEVQNERIRQAKKSVPKPPKTHCRNGHPKSESYVSRSGKIVCRACWKAQAAAYAARQKSK